MKKKNAICYQPENTLRIDAITIQVSTRGRTVEDVLTLCTVKPNLHAVYTLVNDQTVILLYLLPYPIYIWDYPKMQYYIVNHYFVSPKVPLSRQIKVPVPLLYATITFIHEEIVVTKADIEAAIRNRVKRR